MAIEIERKFLVTDNSWKQQAHALFRMKQGYLSQGGERSVRIRTNANGKAYLNIKSSTTGIRRLEYEYEIPLTDAEEILANIALKPVIDKTRYLVKIGGHTWEVDEFYGDNQGLVVAEIELSDEDESFERPAWLGKEVSADNRYYNMNLIQNPYCNWTEFKGHAKQPH